MRRVLVAQDRQQPPQQHVIDDRNPIHDPERTSVGPVAAPRRNIELKASDPDPERSLAVVLGLGARDRGVLQQRDTYFRVEKGRLKLREEEPGGATFVQYDRVDADEARESRYRLDPGRRPEGAVRRAGVEPRRARGGREGAPPAALAVGAHPPRPASRTSANFVELEGVATADSDLADELDKVTRLTEALEIPPERILRNSYSDQVVGSSALVDAARAGDAARPRAVLATSASAPRCGPRTARSTSAPTSRTPPTRRASAPRRPRSARSSPPAAGASPRSP